jgi:hypothetical protein
MLASGLPDAVADGEDLARFLLSSSLFNARMEIKPAAFLPSASDRETSVFRHGVEPRAALWAIGEIAARTRTLHGAAVVKAHDVRAAGLDVISSEPPPRHAAIREWPWLDDDPEERKAQQKERASLIASKATLLLRR